MVESHSFDSGQVASIIGRDRGLVKAVLQLGNTPDYNPSGKHIMDVEQAATRLGQARVAEIARTM